MTRAAEGPGQRRRAPQEDGAVLIDPPLAAAGDLLAANQRLRAAWNCNVHGRSLGELARSAREELLTAARAYTFAYRDVPAAPAGRIVLAGHQPQLFHPGVWLKNFVLSRLGGALSAAAVNLVIDSDTVKQAAVPLPTGTVRRPVVRAVAYDADVPEIPFEDRPIFDQDVWRTFGERATEAVGPLSGAEPLARAFWPLAIERGRVEARLGAALAQARHRQEARWGLATLELPQGRVCDLPAFRWFAVHLLAEAPRFRDAFNRAVIDYRRTHRLRSAAHPFPELAADGDWTEAPFWIWRTDDPRRQPLFVRRTPAELLLSDRGSILVRLPQEASCAVEALAAAAATGIRLRTRALTTTLWARLVLSDLFLHGIGGAQYDEVTDRLIRDFFGLAPPAYLVVTGTLRLPVARPAVGIEDLRRLDRLARELDFQPERHATADGAQFGAQEAIDAARVAKRRWIGVAPTRSNARTRCHAIHGANKALQPFVAAQRQALAAQRAEVVEQLRADAVLASREHPFCCYPEKTLRDFLLEFPGAGP
jgi:hypothetical protein